jgi:O-antigen ligase
MTSGTNPAQASTTRGNGFVEWLVALGLAATVTATALSLGGVRAAEMRFLSPAIFGLAAVGFGAWAVRRDGAAPLNLAAGLPLPFLIWALASVLWRAPARWLAWAEWLPWLQAWLVFALVLHGGRGRAQTWLCVGTLAALGLAGSTMAFYQRYVDPAWLMMGRTQAAQFFGRSSGMFGIPNSFAGLLELMIPVCLAPVFSRATRLPAKLGWAWLAAILLAALVLTGSRGGWIGLGVALVLWPLLAGRGWRRRLLGGAAILAAAGLGLLALYRFSEPAHARIQPFLEGKFESSRPIIWRAGVEMWREDPWLGRGAAAYQVLFDQYRPTGFRNDPIWAHNEYLNTLADYGVVGLALAVAGGAAALALGWRAVRRARREAAAVSPLDGGTFRLGLGLGLCAFAIHLAVDFHTKIPALAFAAAILLGLLLRDEPALRRPVAARTRLLLGALAAGGLAAAAAAVPPVYRAEALRYEARRAIDRYARDGAGDRQRLVAAAREAFARAVEIDPANGQAWADLSYALALGASGSRAELIASGRQAEAAADRALALCPLFAEFWARKGVALDLQARQREADAPFARAIELAPNNAIWRYHAAYHFAAPPQRKTEALQALATCLALDPFYPGAEALRQRLLERR